MSGCPRVKSAARFSTKKNLRKKWGRLNQWGAMVNCKNESINLQSSTAARIDALLQQVAAEYRTLPRCEFLARNFREALARVGLPGGYARRGAVARPLSELLPDLTDLERIL